MARLDFYYDYACPYAYLASTRVEALAARTGAELHYRPMLLGGVFQAIGAPSVPALGPAKAKQNLLDMSRWADCFGVPLTMPATHPNRTVLALRATLAAGTEGSALRKATRALFDAYWAEGRDLSEPAVVRAALDGAGLDGEALVSRAEDPAIKAELRTRTEEAVSRGVFGAPSFFVKGEAGPGELYWGQDRMDLVEIALGGRVDRPAATLPAPGAPPRELLFYFDFSSPFAYLAATQVAEVAARHGATLRYKPFLLGALFKAVGTNDVPLFTMPAAKRAHALADMERWGRHLGVDMRFPSRFPMNTVKALRMVLQVEGPRQAPFIDAVFRAFWAHDRDINDDGVLAAIAGDVGLDGAALLAGAKEDTVKLRLKEATEEAQRRGLFGAPSFLVGDLLFWGQDRLPLVEKALEGWRPRGE